jgi:hypothetical protein
LGVTLKRFELRSFLIKFWPELVAVVAPLIVYWQIMVGGQVLYWGLPSLQFVPWQVMVTEAFRQGHLPLWTPLLGMGAPILANYQSAPLYAPNWLALLLPPETAISVMAVLHLSWAGLGIVRLARRMGLNDFGLAMSGLAFGLSGYLTGRMWFITINNAVAWMPWVVLLAPPGWGKGYSLKRFLALTLVLTMQLLSGHAQSTFYTLLLAGGWMVWRALRINSELHQTIIELIRPLVKYLVLFGVAVIFAVGIAALQLVPTYELLKLSPRASSADFDFVATYSLWPWRVFTFVIPNLFGHPIDHNYFGYATYWEDNAYAGLLPLVFAIYSVYWGLRFALSRWWKWQVDLPASKLITGYIPLLVLISGVSILLAFGKNTPIFPFYYRYIPGFNLFQAPARMLVWYSFAFSLLAGIGAHVWRASDRKRYWSRLGIAGSLAMLALGVGGALALTNARGITFGTGIAWAAGFGVGVFALLLLQNDSKVWMGAALALVVFDLGLAGVRATPTTSRALYQQSPAFAKTDGRLFEFADDDYQVKFGELLRFQSFDPLNEVAYRNSLLTNLNVLSGMASANNFDPLTTARYAAYLKLMETSPRLLDLAGVSAIVKPAGAVTVWTETPTRMRVIYDAQTVNSAEEAEAAISAADFDPDQRVTLEAPLAGWYGLALDPNRTTETVTLDKPGYVVLSDTFYPGWRVLVDGMLQPLLIADLNFRAVAVGSGAHTVTFEYAPFSATLGLIISLMAGLIFIGLSVWALRRPQRGHDVALL